jgi:hypothetical protein
MTPIRLARPLMMTVLALGLSACMGDTSQPEVTRAPMTLPEMHWDHRPEAPQWTAATLAALSTYGAALPQSEPADIAVYCPAYDTAGPSERRAFWSGLFSALAKYESRWNPEAKGGGGRYIGLLQISPRTAQDADCTAESAGELTDGAANLSCAVKIAARRAPDGDGGARVAGILNDWGPMKSAGNRAEIAAWTAQQSYCRSATRG